MVQGVALDPSAGRAALQGGIPSPAELQQPMDGPPMPEDPNKPFKGDPQLQTPPSHLLSGPTQRTPEFLRHRQLPVLPGDAGTAVVTPVPEAEGRIYESIRCKPGMLRKPWEERSGQGDSPSLSPRDEPSIPQLEVTSPEEPGSQGNPDPVYAKVVKPPRVPQPLQPQEAAPAQAETAPSLPEKALPCGTGCPGDVWMFGRCLKVANLMEGFPSCGQERGKGEAAALESSLLTPKPTSEV
ncbi:titin-like [Heliangelus exortis]|uniref:titin-like n=1 Tax=Heliangelus exortis TaxID=472823 RepID=UPI003A8F57DC